MPTDKPRFSITMEQEPLDKITRYQHRNKFKTQTQAVIDLIGKGLMHEIQHPSRIPVLTGEELTLINNWKNSSVDVKNKIRIILSEPIIHNVEPETPVSYSPITLLSLFEAADIDVKNEIIAQLIDHANEKLQTNTSLAEAHATAAKIINDEFDAVNRSIEAK